MQLANSVASVWSWSAVICGSGPEPVIPSPGAVSALVWCDASAAAASDAGAVLVDWLPDRALLEGFGALMVWARSLLSLEHSSIGTIKFNVATRSLISDAYISSLMALLR